MFKSYPIITRFLLFVLVPLTAAAIGFIIYLRGSLPVDDGRSIKAGVLQPVEITRDDNSVVIINARTDRDAFFAIGYAHAQDRMWQLELERRIAQGRLSEVFGRSAVSRDVWMRTLGLYESAESAWSKLSPEAQASLTAYADGINAWLDQDPTLPPEFLALGVRPAPWREVDSLAWSKVFALNLSNNMWNEISNMVASQYLSKEQMTDLLGYCQSDLPSVPKAADGANGKSLADLLAFRKGLESELKIGGQYVGSNAWVVSGKFMQEGHSVLANDPHLGLQVPSLWYAAHLKGDRLDASGMTLVGLPIVVFGRNGEVAWGGTSLMADAQDLYIEQTNPEDPTQYKHGNAWVSFQTRSETIDIKADFPASLRAPVEPVTIRVRKSLNGPIISDVIDTFEQPVALRWTALDPDDTSYETFFRVNYAHDWATFKEAFRSYVAPAMNMLYVDKSDNIGSIGVGRIPIRAKGQGRHPVPAWTDEYAWSGYIPFNDLPQSFNPEKGYIVSANNKVIAPDYRYFISADWAPPSRAQRIEQLLQDYISKGELISIDSVERMQGDTIDLSVRGLLDYLKQVSPNGPEQQRALNYLSAWEGDMARDSQGAAIFFVWARHLREELFLARLKEFWNRQAQSAEIARIATDTSYDQILNALNDRSSKWCGSAGSTDSKSCDSLLSDSLDRAINELKRLRGSNMESWRWGDIHHTLYEHLPFSNMGFLAQIFECEIPSGGSRDTINVANAIYNEKTGYEQTFGAGFRQVIKMGGESAYHAYMNSTGQSGNVTSGHYNDMVKPFRDLQYHVLGGDSVAGGRVDLTITPE